MNESMTERSLSPGTSPLLRRVDGIELPTAGTWNVPANHATIALSRPSPWRRLESSQARTSGATIDIWDDPDRVAIDVWLEAPGIATVRSRYDPLDSPARLHARAIRGRDPWTMAGNLFTATAACPVRAQLTYHGLWHGGRDDRDYAWFVLAGVIDARRGRWQRRPQFSFHLLAYAPNDDIADCRATGRARQGSNPESHMVPA
jgi:hypothetical protein